MKLLATHLLLLQLLAPLALAGSGADSSGGGNGVVCFDDASIPSKIRKDGGNLSNRYVKHIVSVEAYDLYVAKRRYGADALIQVGDESAPLMAYGSWVNKQLYALVPYFSWEVEQSAAQLPQAQILNQPFGLIKVDDVAPDAEYDSSRCVLATMAAHYKDESSYFLHLDRRLFDHPTHSRWSKEVLLLHEFVYMYARRLGHATSKDTRDVIAMMLRERTGLTATAWVDFLYEKNFRFEGERHLGYPGGITYFAVIQLINAAVDADRSWWGIVEPPQVVIANQALAEFGSRCENKYVAGCIHAILKLERDKREGVERLAPLKEKLLQVFRNKSDDTAKKLSTVYWESIQPKFAKMPYGPEVAREKVPPAAFENAIQWILGGLALHGSLDTTDEARRKLYLSNARALAREVESYFDLNANPLEKP